MKDKEIPICVNCAHAYVCEEYNLNRNMLIKRCAYYNDHFLDIEQYKKQTIKETAREIFAKIDEELGECTIVNKGGYGWHYQGYKATELRKRLTKLAKEFGLK